MAWAQDNPCPNAAVWVSEAQARFDRNYLAALKITDAATPTGTTLKTEVHDAAGEESIFSLMVSHAVCDANDRAPDGRPEVAFLTCWPRGGWPPPAPTSAPVLQRKWVAGNDAILDTEPPGCKAFRQKYATITGWCP
ncbi:hypothetical protein CAC42_7263 [Sphaceloma murrayae]|uniref:Uncharacterized protein n=1 Tax=Sphaceloma murrayae TaxID=2082308 RepID=A0A2K1QQF9_9PEZI|nr:hypothetical protein CAC42_7263 [Sphaceloma murrayae]